MASSLVIAMLLLILLAFLLGFMAANVSETNETVSEESENLIEKAQTDTGIVSLIEKLFNIFS